MRAEEVSVASQCAVTLPTHQQKVMIFWLCPQILEDRLLPVPFHVIPVIDLPMSDGITNAISRSFCVCDCLVADEEV